MTDIVKRLVGLANSLGGDDEDIIMAGVADNERLRKCICDMYSIWRNAAEEREAEIKRLTALRGDEAVAENARVVAEFAKLRAEIERLTALAQSNDDITWELTGENMRLRAALQQIAAEADGGRLSANDDELRDWLMAIRDVARRALEPKP